MTRKSLEYSAQQRAGLVAYWLSAGGKLSDRELTERLEMTPEGERHLMRNLEKVLPIENRNGQWQTFVIA